MHRRKSEARRVPPVDGEQAWGAMMSNWQRHVAEAPRGSQQPRIEPSTQDNSPFAIGEKETPEEGLEPSTTRLRALRSTD